MSWANWFLFQPNWMQRVVAKIYSVSFQLFSLWRLNFTPRIIRVLRAFRFTWSSTSSSNCSVFLEYSSNLKFVILLSSSICSNLFVLYSANVLLSFTLMSISFSLLFSWQKMILVYQTFSSSWPFWSKVGKVTKSQLPC